MTAPAMDAVNMSAFLGHLSRRHPQEFLVLVLDGAPSHRARDLRTPPHMALVRLPPYSPELNPAERLWDEIREKGFSNRVFDSLGAAIAQAVRGLKRLEDAPAALRSLTGWDWIIRSSCRRLGIRSSGSACPSRSGNASAAQRTVAIGSGLWSAAAEGE
jgi:transposase